MLLNVHRDHPRHLKRCHNDLRSKITETMPKNGLKTMHSVKMLYKLRIKIISLPSTASASFKCIFWSIGVAGGCPRSTKKFQRAWKRPPNTCTVTIKYSTLLNLSVQMMWCYTPAKSWRSRPCDWGALEILGGWFNPRWVTSVTGSWTVLLFHAHFSQYRLQPLCTQIRHEYIFSQKS